jgi:glucose-6-phosphate 1-dehydrogenase
MVDTQQPTILIIFGITGDLAKRKLLPAIERIVGAGVAPGRFQVIGTTRHLVPLEDIIQGVQGVSPDFLNQHVRLQQLDPTDPEEYKQLAETLNDIEHDWGMPAQRLFYLSVPPQVSRPIIAHLGEADLHAPPHTKLLLEKPFGTDYASAQQLVEQTRQYFSEDQIYRIDHYLAKEMAQNLIVFRQDNVLFQRTWDKAFISSIAITATEQIGIEGRAGFYEQTGALRDLIQSHLLQLAALVLMETPASGTLQEVPARRLDALRQLSVPSDKPLQAYIQRAQYKGYREEVGNTGSMVETYVRMMLRSSDPRWEGVPISLTTGKALDQKVTEIRITYKKEDSREANELTIRIQPDEGIELCLWAKVPGYAWRMEQRSLHMNFKDSYDMLPEAYEQVFLEAINGNHALFTSSDEVLETWRILAPIQSVWAMADDDLVVYEPGAKPSDIG